MRLFLFTFKFEIIRILATSFIKFHTVAQELNNIIHNTLSHWFFFFLIFAMKRWALLLKYIGLNNKSSLFIVVL